MTIEVTDAAQDYLAEVGYDPVFGARPLKRAIQQELVDRLALAFLDGEIREGQHVVVDLRPDGSGLTFHTAGRADRREEQPEVVEGEIVGE